MEEGVREEEEEEVKHDVEGWRTRFVLRTRTPLRYDDEQDLIAGRQTNLRNQECVRSGWGSEFFQTSREGPNITRPTSVSAPV